jgi:hypothetical protein
VICKGGLAKPAALLQCSTGDFKFPKRAAKILPLDIEAVDTRDGRPFAAPIDQIRDLLARPLDHRLHPAIGKIAHPPVDLAAHRGLEGFPAECHTLHPSGNQKSGPDIGV